MVAALVGLRFRVLANNLVRSPLQLVAVIVGAVPVMVVLAFALSGSVLLSQAPGELASLVVIGFGSLLVVGWVVGPLLIDGVDDSLDPVRLARFPVPPRILMAATVAATLLWIPGAATLIAATGTAFAWLGRPTTMAAAVIGGILGALTCIASARAATSIAGMRLRGRGSGRTATVALALLLVVPFVALVVVGLGAADLVGPLVGAIEVLAWTPIGAAWAIPGLVDRGDGAGAAAAAAIAIGTLGAALLLWRVALSRVAVRSGGAGRARGAGGLGLLSHARGSTSAVAIRSLVYWFRDARRTRQLLLIPAVPLLVLLWARLLDSEPLALAIGPIVACLVPLSAFAELSYDGTAFGMHIAAGIRGRIDRSGRAASLAAITVPATVVVVVGVAAVIGRVDTLPALLGLSLCVALTAIGVVSVSSAWFVVPVPRAGRNPFAAPPGGITLSVVASYGVLLATALLSAPVVAIALFALATDAAGAGWLAFGLGPVIGIAVVAAGVVLGGRLLDATAPETLSRLRALRS